MVACFSASALLIRGGRRTYSSRRVDMGNTSTMQTSASTGHLSDEISERLHHCFLSADATLLGRYNTVGALPPGSDAAPRCIRVLEGRRAPLDRRDRDRMLVASPVTVWFLAVTVSRVASTAVLMVSGALLVREARAGTHIVCDARRVTIGLMMEVRGNAR